MIWGKTRDQQRVSDDSKIVYAWWPVLLEDGRTAWLEWVERRWYDDPGENWAGGNSGWRYYELKDWDGKPSPGAAPAVPHEGPPARKG